MSFPFGTSVKVSAVFYDEDGDSFDPTTVTCKVKSPDDPVVTYVYLTDVALIRDSVGHYHLWVETNQAGTYTWGFEGAGPETVTNETTFDIDESTLWS